MQITTTSQVAHNNITSVTFRHPRTGYQIIITPGPRGFVVKSSQGVRMTEYSKNVYELLSEIGGFDAP